MTKPVNLKRLKELSGNYGLIRVKNDNIEEK